jgi:ferritin-like metal-binding protein YciE
MGTDLRTQKRVTKLRMADMNERDAKLVQYLSEAFGKESELAVALEAHIAMNTKAAYKKRLKQHLKETKGHAKALQRRIKQLGGGTQTVQSVAGVVKAAAKGPLHAVRGSGEQEKMLKNAKTEYFNEHEEIATYLAIETFALKVGDKETAQLARAIRREEERMAEFLESQIKQLSNAVAIDEVPAKQRSSKAAKKAKAKPAASSKAKPASRSKAKATKRAKAKSASPKKAQARKAVARTKKAASRPKKAASRSKAKTGK